MVRCLIVDDDELTCEVSARALSSIGIDTIVETDSVAALLLCAARMPNFILLDISMPRVDGFTFIQELRKIRNAKHAKIVVSTGLSDIDTVQRLKTEGVVDYLAKPYSMDLLIKKFSKLNLF